MNHYLKEMQVKSITATCTTEGTFKRTMQLYDRDSFDGYNHEASLSIPAIEGVGTGDVLNLLVTFKHPATEDEAERQLEAEVSKL